MTIADVAPNQLVDQLGQPSRVLERTITETALLRAVGDDDEDDGTLGVLYGHAARFDEWTEIDNWFEGHFMERIAPGAFKRTIKNNLPKIRCLFKHGYDPAIGDKVLAKVRALQEDSEGLYYEAGLYDTPMNRDLEPGLRDGQYGASFRAAIVKSQINQKPPKSEHNPNGIPEVSYTELALREFGPCTFGAYPTATSALRSSLDELWPKLRDDPDLLDQFLARAHDLRTSRTDPATGTSATEEPATSTDSDPADRPLAVNRSAVRVALMRHCHTITKEQP